MNVDLAKIAAAVKDRAEQAWKFADTKWEEIAKVAIDEYRRQFADGNAGKTPGQVARDAWGVGTPTPEDAWERVAATVLATFGGKEAEQVKQWYRELLDVIYADMPDGMNERPDPRQLVKMWKDAYGKESPAQQEADEPECPHDETDHGICLSCSKQTDPNAPKFDTPTPPPGYHIATEAERKKLPVGSKYWNIDEWVPASGPIGKEANNQFIYACPDTGAELVTESDLKLSVNLDTNEVDWKFLKEAIDERFQRRITDLQSRLAAAEKERDEAHQQEESLRARLNSVTEEMAERGVECEKLRAQLAAIGWRPISIKPTQEDADMEGFILYRGKNGHIVVISWNSAPPKWAVEWLPLSRFTPERERFDSWWQQQESNSAETEEAWTIWQAARKEGGQ